MIEKTWRVELKLRGKKHVMFVNALSDIEAVYVARNLVKDWRYIAHIISAKTI